MKYCITAFINLILTIFLCTSMAFANGVEFDFLAASPEGSWQLREDSDTNHKGKETITVVKTSILEKENRNGEPHYWIEMGMDTFKVTKKGKRKPKGKRLIVKSLIAEQALRGDSANIMKNLRGFGEEVIIQNGKETPTRMSNSGGLVGSLLNAMGAEIRYDYSNQGSETVETPAGTFETDKLNGKGEVNIKTVFKKVHVESDTTMWVSPKVPFGIVLQQGSTISNGKTSTQSSKLLEFGMSGAVSEITKEPENMPEFGGLLGG